MNYIKLIAILLLLSGCGVDEIQAQKDLRSEVIIETSTYTVSYNEILQQPNWLEYTSTNRVKNVDRGSMDFKLYPGVITSDKHDYYKNIYDKGHLAPAATFSDSMDNLEETFYYLNCALQNQDLNRGEWRLLEQEERKWDDSETLTVSVDLIFDEDYIVLKTGAAIPTDMVKHIYFNGRGSWRCFEFENKKPTKGWEEHEVTHSH
jgi:endonuclease G